MNRNQIIFIVVPFLLIFGFQNCQNSNFDSATGASVDPSMSVSFRDEKSIVLADENLQRLQFKAEEVVQVPHVSTSFSLIKSFIYDFDLSNGDFDIVDSDTQSHTKYCLTEEMKAQVNAILNGDLICKKKSQVQEGTVCAQVISTGYSTLVTHRDEFHLGSSSDSCGSNSIDLCANKDQLKIWFSNVQAHLSSLSCNP